MEKLLRWRVLTPMGIVLMVMGVIAAFDKEGLGGIVFALAGATFFTSGVRLYLAERGDTPPR